MGASATPMPQVPDPSLDPYVGRTFGDYEVIARVGGGAMGVVYRARHVRLNSPRALKFLPPQWSHDDEAKQRFRREAEAASTTDHPNICTIHDICETPDGQQFIVMAFCDGPTLKQRLAEGPLPVAAALEIATQMASGLGKAHQQGVIHRDVKPGNVILTEDGVRLVDFGLATFADALQLTAAGTPLGTAAYMSPEQVRGERVDAKTDVWAVGVVLYQMLTGRLPFGGARGEQVAQAILHDTPVPVRVERPEVPEAIEQIVFRALHKEPSVRYENGRDLARALRVAQGLGDRTDVVPVPAGVRVPASRGRPARVTRAGVAVGIVAAGAALWWTFWAPVERVPVVIAPFSNQTGDDEIDRYRLALTQAAALSLRDSDAVAPLSYARLLEALEPFLQRQRDVSSREAIQALAVRADGAVVLTPTLLRDGGAWRVRLEARNPVTSTPDWTFESAPLVSSLSLDTTYQLALGLAEPIEAHYGTGRGRLRRRMAAWLGQAQPMAAGFTRSLETAKAFEEGMRVFESLEYASARTAFAAALETDARNPMLLAWRSRTAQLLRLDSEAIEAADQALAALTPSTPERDAAFVRAVAAEARRETDAAEAEYRRRLVLRPADVEASMDLAAFLDRQLRTEEAVAVYHEVIRRVPSSLRPHLELCRLYSPARLNEPADAVRQGELALKGYDTSGGLAGRAQSLLCLADTLRVGTGADRKKASGYITEASRIFESLGFGYNAARADYYAAIVAGMDGRYAESVSLNERALARAETSANTPLQPLVLTNLGVAHVELGNRDRAADYYQRAYAIYQSWREEVRAARVQANRGALLIDYGNPDEGFRDVRNALAVFQKLGDKSFEVFCLRVIATYYRNQGRHRDAISELNKGLAIARERGLDGTVTIMTTRLGISAFELGQYEVARDQFSEAAKAGGRQSAEARLRLARTFVRLGQLGEAAAELDRAAAQLEEAGQTEGSPLLWLVRAEWALESGRGDEARAHLARGAGMGTGGSPDIDTVEARARLGWMEAQAGRPQGVRELRESLEAARAMRHRSLEARCRVWLAQLAFAAGRDAEAAAELQAIPPDDAVASIDPELRAEVHHWTSRIWSRRGDATRAAAEGRAAGDVLLHVSDALGAPLREAFRSRRSVAALTR